MKRPLPTIPRPRTDHSQVRRGAFLVFACFCLVLAIMFVALGIDLGVVQLTKTRLQNAVDAAALAAAQEITAALENATEDGDAQAGDAGDANSIAVGAAKAMAQQVTNLNGVYIDPDRDVEFGKRTYNDASGQFGIEWGASPFNVVRVTARRDNESLDAPDGKLQLFFAGIMGKESTSLTASAIAFVEARDIVVVLDYSGSMNDDSTLAAIGKLSKNDVEANLQEIFEALEVNVGTMPFVPTWPRVPGYNEASGNIPKVHVTFKDTEIYVESTKDLSNVVMEFSNGNKQKIEGLSGKTGTFKGSGSNNGKRIVKCWVKSGSNSSGDGPGYGEKIEFSNTNIKRAFGLNAISYPYPQGSWDEYIDYCESSNSQASQAGYRYKFGGLTFTNYLLDKRASFAETPDLWKTPHYPFQAMKEGMTLFTEFLEELNFGDHLGLVTYDDSARIETSLDSPYYEESVDLGNNWLTQNYAAIDTIQRHKQASHYSMFTGIGYGLQNALDLIEEHGRPGARPTILLMTDGLANRSPSGWKLPNNWDWSKLTDYDGDGSPNYTSSDKNVQYAFWQAKAAIDKGYTIHTLNVGIDGDRSMMKAVAFAGGGEFIDVPGGANIGEMEAQMLAAFAKIAAKVPPAKLLHDPNQ